MNVKAEAIDVRSQIGCVRGNIGGKCNRRSKGSQIGAGVGFAAKIRVQVFPFDRQAAADLDFSARACSPADEGAVFAAVFVGRGKGIGEQRLVIGVCHRHATSAVDQ